MFDIFVSWRILSERVRVSRNLFYQSSHLQSFTKNLSPSFLTEIPKPSKCCLLENQDTASSNNCAFAWNMAKSLLTAAANYSKNAFFYLKRPVSKTTCSKLESACKETSPITVLNITLCTFVIDSDANNSFM